MNIPGQQPLKGQGPRTRLHDKADEIAESTGLVLGKEIYRANYYSPDLVRDLIVEGTYEGKPVVLKIYDDQRITDEPFSQVMFNKVNTSDLLVAPEVYTYEVESPHSGWFIMEKLPEGSESFPQPVTDKEEFAHLFLEYRRHFPTEPTRPLLLAEQLPADEYHVYRIGRWLELGTAKEADEARNGRPPILEPKEFLPRHAAGLDIIRKEFSNRKMVWCHGHFKPHELFRIPGEQRYFLTDFAHSKMYPEGHEFAFMIWADWIIPADWTVPYEQWKTGVVEWIEVLRPVAEELGCTGYDSLIRASLVERLFGTILADVCAGERPREEKEMRLPLLYRLFDELAAGALPH